jgi:hypothetical protein
MKPSSGRCLPPLTRSLNLIEARAGKGGGARTEQAHGDSSSRRQGAATARCRWLVVAAPAQQARGVAAAATCCRRAGKDRRS